MYAHDIYRHEFNIYVLKIIYIHSIFICLHNITYFYVQNDIIYVEMNSIFMFFKLFIFMFKLSLFGLGHILYN